MYDAILVASASEALRAGISFPAIAIPFGAGDGEPCYCFQEAGEMTDEAVEDLLSRSVVHKGRGERVFHLQHMASSSNNPLPFGLTFLYFAT